jgi:hypothetical protein
MVEGQRYGVYGHDWRTVPPLAWLALLGEREIATTPEISSAPTTDSLIVLNKTDFAEAVRTALRDFSQLDALRVSPLLRSRLIMERGGMHAGEKERISTLQAVLREAVEQLRLSPRQMKSYRTIYHTYIQPAPTQEQAAELLDLPFSTYRRHLKNGLEQVVDSLWHVEVGHLEN